MRCQKRLLVIEDDSITTGLIKIILTRPEFDVVVKDSLEAGWHELSGPKTFDAILLDRQLPDGDGIGFLRRVKSHKAHAQTPVIIETSMKNVSDIQDGLAAGAYYYLTKPLEPMMMLAVVNAAIEQRHELIGIHEQTRDALSALKLLNTASFEFRTLHQARALAMVLSKACADPASANFGLLELFVNAVEHGNLEITYQEKSALLIKNTWLQEVERRSKDPRFINRVVTVSCEQKKDTLTVSIQDQGKGFDWEQYLSLSPDRAYDPHGRGIALANMNSFVALKYQGNGNSVIAVLNNTALSK